MKIIISCLLSILFTECQNKPDNILNDAAIHFSGIFITENIPSAQTLRIKGSTVVKVGADSTYHLKGIVEGFTSFNVPVNIEHFNETLHYSGGDPNDKKNWKCIEIYVGTKKIK